MTMLFDIGSFSRDLAREIDMLRELVALLHDEQQALIHGALDELGSFVEPKASRLMELTRLSQARAQLLRAHELPADHTGMERLLGEQARDARAAWQKTLALTADAHRLNEINGTLIATRLRGTQHALAVLFSAARIPGAYAADGSTVPFHTAHRRAVA
jgi:flagellar biosynthesis/type III secretory pathway chaperone